MTRHSRTEFSLSLSNIELNDVTLNVAQGGRGDPILFLHGFPDHWGTWGRLMKVFAETHHVIAPDLRGYGDSSRPTDVSAYKPETLIADVTSLMQALDLQNTTIIGHDWGATLAFWTAMTDASRISDLIILNGAHPYLLQDRIWDDPQQRRASQYVRDLCTDGPHPWLRDENAPDIARQWLAPALAENKLNQSEYDDYIALWSETGAWQAMRNWYRASPFDIPALDDRAPTRRWTTNLDYTVPCHVHVIWGQSDPIFTDQLVEDLRPYVPKLQVSWLAEAGHVPHRDNLPACIKAIRSAISPEIDRPF